MRNMMTIVNDAAAALPFMSFMLFMVNSGILCSSNCRIQVNVMHPGAPVQRVLPASIPTCRRVSHNRPNPRFRVSR